MEPRYAVVHTAAFHGRNLDAALIDHWHKQRGWSGIGYHFVILDDRHDSKENGALERGRAENQQGAHVLGLNDQSLGICLAGNGDHRRHTIEQRRTLIRLLSSLIERHDIVVERIIGHREITDLAVEGVVPLERKTSKTCPGTLISMNKIRDQVREYRRTGILP